MEKATRDAIKTFGDENSINIILEKSYEEYIHGFKDEETGKVIKGYTDICNEIISKFPEPTEIILEADKKRICGAFWRVAESWEYPEKFWWVWKFWKDYLRQADAGYEECLCWY